MARARGVGRRCQRSIVRRERAAAGPTLSIEDGSALGASLRLISSSSSVSSLITGLARGPECVDTRPRVASQGGAGKAGRRTQCRRQRAAGPEGGTEVGCSARRVAGRARQGHADMQVIHAGDPHP